MEAVRAETGCYVDTLSTAGAVGASEHLTADTFVQVAAPLTRIAWPAMAGRRTALISPGQPRAAG